MNKENRRRKAHETGNSASAPDHHLFFVQHGIALLLEFRSVLSSLVVTAAPHISHRFQPHCQQTYTAGNAQVVIDAQPARHGGHALVAAVIQERLVCESAYVQQRDFS